MDKAMKIALILTAVDQMSNVVDGAVNKSLNSLDKFKPAMQKVRDGLMLWETGKQGFAMLGPAKEAFGEMEAAGNRLKAAMLGKGGVLDAATYGQMFKLSEELSEKYANSTDSYLDMMQVLRNNKISEQDILGGVALSTAKLADLFDNMNPAKIGEFAARMRNDMGVTVQQMDQMMDIVARVKNVGVGKTGEEAVEEMNQFFSKVGLGLANLHVQGLEAGKQMAALGTIFMRRGISGQSVGTNLRRILDGIRDPARFEKAQKEAAKFGKNLEMFDKQGKFLGVENLVIQMSKLQGLNPTAIADILKPFSGRQGLSTDFLEFLANDGLSSYKDIIDQMDRQANLDEKLQVIMGGMNYQQKVMEAGWRNLKATFFSSVGPALTTFLELLNRMIVNVRKFIELHPMLSKVIIAIVTIVSSLLMLAGAIKIIQGVAMAMKFLNITMLANPVLLIAAAVATATLLIIKYWTQIKLFFVGWGHAIANSFKTVLGWMKTVFLYTNPIGWVILSWKPVMNFFSGFGQTIKNVFNDIIDWISGLWTRFMEAGKMIVKGLWAGIKAVVMWPINEIKKMIDNIKHVVTFGFSGSAMTPAPVAGFGTDGSYRPAYAPIGGNRTTLQFNGGPIHLSGGATKADAERVTSMQKEQFAKMLKDHEANKKRVSY